MAAAPLRSFIPLSSCNDSSDNVLCKLMHTAMELERVRSEGRLRDAQIWRLKELLSTATKERDEARQECRKLQECMLSLQAPTMRINSAPSSVHSSSSSPWSLQELEQRLNSDDFSPPVNPSELQQALESLVQSCHEEGRHGYAVAQADFHHQGLAMEASERDLCSDAPACLNLAVLQEMEGVRQSPGSCSVRSLSRQSSSNSSSSSVHSRHFLREAGLPSVMPKMPPARALAASVAPSPLLATACSASYVGNADSGRFRALAASQAGSSMDSTVSTVTSINPKSTGSAVESQKYPNFAAAINAAFSATRAATSQASGSLRQTHLPEPPEADPRVMLSSLPQKGKLLQAVIEAGPLLQTLLLAGSLPQWRHPPPPLSTRDIPRVSLPPPNAMSSICPLAINRKRVSVEELSSQTKKLKASSRRPLAAEKASRQQSSLCCSEGSSSPASNFLY